MTTTMSSNVIVPEVLESDNYEIWNLCVKNYLLAHDLWDVVESTNEPPKQEDGVEDFRAWRKKNAAALHAIQVSCGKDALYKIRFTGQAKNAWYILADSYDWSSALLSLTPTPSPSASPLLSSSISSPAQRRPSFDSPLLSSSISSPAQLPPSLLASPVLSSSVSSPGQVPAVSVTASAKEEFLQYLPLCNAIIRGDWDSTKQYIDQKPEIVNSKITFNGWTALNIASLSGQITIAKELVELMSTEAIEIKDYSKSTALNHIAYNGITEIAQFIISKNLNLVGIPDHEDKIPLAVAAYTGHRELASYLYSVTPKQLLVKGNSIHGFQVLDGFISNSFFDFALHLLQCIPILSTPGGTVGCDPLYSLSDSAYLSPIDTQLPLWRRWLFSRMKIQITSKASYDVHIHIKEEHNDWRRDITVQGQLRRCLASMLTIFGIKQLYEMKRTRYYALKVLRCMSKHTHTLNSPQRNMSAIKASIFNSVKNGTVLFLVETLKANPDMILIRDEDGRTIFHLAIVHRQEKIFNLIYGIPAFRTAMAAKLDNSSNTMSHLAGLAAPASRLACISGAALQMQRELQWFKEVESCVAESYRGHTNRDGKTPREVFSDNHKDLLINGEKWLKETATSGTIVGALIITIMFAATFTLPGGNNQDTGHPVFGQKPLFIVFIISTAVSLFSSNTSILMFLAILSSRYAEEDFLLDLPTKMMTGLSMLFISMAAMMVAFCSTLFLMMPGNLWVVFLLVLLASVPVILFVFLQFHLLLEMFLSTFRPRIFDRSTKPWL